MDDTEDNVKVEVMDGSVMNGALSKLGVDGSDDNNSGSVEKEVVDSVSAMFQVGWRRLSEQVSLIT